MDCLGVANVEEVVRRERLRWYGQSVIHVECKDKIDWVSEIRGWGDKKGKD